MKNLIKDLKHEFKDHYSESGLLPKLRFKPYETKHKLLIIGPEHGDKPFCTRAIVEFMRGLKQSKLEQTLVDFVPVIDIKGYPSKRTIIGKEGLGKPLYLDNGYKTSNPPQEVKDLLNIINGSYNLVVQLNSNFVEESPLLDGYYIIPPITVEGNKLKYDPLLKDLVGSVINDLKKGGFKLLAKTSEYYLGDGHVLVDEGIVLPGIEDNDKIKLMNTNALVLKAAEKGAPAILFYSAATKVKGKMRSEAVEAHKSALKSLIKVYERF